MLVGVFLSPLVLIFTLVFLCASDDYKNAQSCKSPLLEITYNWPNNNNLWK